MIGRQALVSSAHMCKNGYTLATKSIVDTVDKVRVDKVVDFRFCRRLVESQLSPACSTCSTRSTLSKVGDVCRPNVERPFDFDASVYLPLHTVTVRVCL